MRKVPKGHTCEPLKDDAACAKMASPSSLNTQAA